MHDKEIKELIRQRLTLLGRPTTQRDLLKQLKLKADNRASARYVIQKMLEAGELASTRVGSIGLPDKMNLVAGRLEVKRGGFGFVVPEEKGRDDIYVSKQDLADALHGDRVLVHIERSGREGKPEGRIADVLERRSKTVVGRLEIDAGGTRLVPFDPRMLYEVLLPGKDLLGAVPGEMIVAEITRYPSAFRGPLGRVIEVLGNADDPGVDVRVILEKHGIPEHFPDDVLAAAEAIGEEVDPAELDAREDFRERPIVTIDGETARDFDDAVEVERLANGNLRLGVHIADVSYYVREGGPLDEEAFARGTSVYFPDRAVPMLPERLSNGICSLKPGVDRLVQSVFVDVSPSGEVLGSRFTDGVIRSAARMTYTKVRQILVERDADVRAEHEALLPGFDRMLELFEILRKRRMDRGAIDFDRPEAELVLDDEGRTIDIRPSERNVAHRIIEEFMLLANEAVATHFSDRAAPAISRVHEEPDELRVADFEDFVLSLGFRLRAPAESLHPRVFQRLLGRIHGRPEEKLIAFMMLRAMKKAHYTSEQTGHYALATRHYTHFTSPIRRYPDLIVHRLLRELRRGAHLEEEGLQEIAEACSTAERRAESAERELVEWKKVRFMSDKVGDVFPALVSGVTGFGLYVELLDVFVEGLVHISTLGDDYYHFDDKTHSLRGESTGRRFRLGDEVTVQLTRANLSDRQLDFAIEGLERRSPQGRRTRHR